MSTYFNRIFRLSIIDKFGVAEFNKLAILLLNCVSNLYLSFEILPDLSINLLSVSDY